MLYMTCSDQAEKTQLQQLSKWAAVVLIVEETMSTIS